MIRKLTKIKNGAYGLVKGIYLYIFNEDYRVLCKETAECIDCLPTMGHFCEEHDERFGEMIFGRET